VLWSAQLPMGSEGLPAIYSIGKKHFIVVNATTPLVWGLGQRRADSPAHVGTGHYVVFALP
jgi:quinoprotein glucose dehydrogenase